MRRAILVTDEMRELAAFKASGRDIDAARRRGSDRTAKRKIKALMARLLQAPSERTVAYFLEMQEQWGHLVDVYSSLQTHWSTWARFEDRLSLIRHKLRNDPITDEVTDTIYSVFQEFESWRSTLGLGYRIGVLVDMIMEKCQNNRRLSNELIALLEWRYQHVINVRKYVSNVHQRRYRTLEHRYNKHV